MKKLSFIFLLFLLISCTTISIKEQTIEETSLNNWAYIIIKNDILSNLPKIIHARTGNPFYDITIARADLLHKIGEELKSKDLDPQIKKDFIKEARYNISLLDKLDTINDFRGKYHIQKAPFVLQILVDIRNKLATVTIEIESLFLQNSND